MAVNYGPPIKPVPSKGRPPMHQATEQTRAEVRAWSKLGLTKKQMMSLLGMTGTVDRQYRHFNNIYAEEYEQGRAELVMKASSCMLRLLEQDSYPAAAMILKKFANWGKDEEETVIEEPFIIDVTPRKKQDAG